MRLDKYLAESYVGTRKQVRTLIIDGKVTVNGEVIIDPAIEIENGIDEIRYKDEIIKHPGKRYIMFHKPAGCITAKTDEKHKTVMDYFTEEDRKGLFPVGRLDKDTEGLLLLTNDGEFDNQLMHPNHHVSKKYFFWVLGIITEEKKELLENGVAIEGEGKTTSPAKLEIIQSGKYDDLETQIPSYGYDTSNIKNDKYVQMVTAGYITITEGKKHQVKRMLKAVGCYVIYLKRMQIGQLVLDEKLRLGEYRELAESEFENITPFLKIDIF
ncbi:pseudouridine synthase [Anaerosporobacter sp.]|uniref:pseudouridine synthase n=1 Tax=Anaerosporobacter sp. TaxID=1872529 RepID=UPI00286EFE94|nr:pseudouridine synthase [Anaerosporobacter sp.]